MTAIPIVNKIIDRTEVQNCTYATIQNLGVGTSTIEVVGTSVHIPIEPNTSVVIYNGFGAVTDLGINVIEHESSLHNLVIIATKRTC